MESMVCVAGKLARVSLRFVDGGTTADKRAGRTGVVRAQSFSGYAAEGGAQRAIPILVHERGNQAEARTLVAARNAGRIRAGARARARWQDRNTGFSRRRSAHKVAKLPGKSTWRYSMICSRRRVESANQRLSFPHR